MTAAFPSIQPSGDQCLIVVFDTVIDVDVNRRACAFVRRVQAAALPGVVDVVPAYAAVGVHYRAGEVRRDVGETPFAGLRRAVEALLAEPLDTAEAAGREVAIPVCYGGEFGPDLADVAAATGLAEAEVLRLHGATVGRVFMIGFAPGHPFIGLWSEQLAIPRRQTPRTRVPAGSVAIANRQGNVYPFDLPGGWNVIGRTPLVMFDAQREPPGLLQAGDTVRFVPVQHEEFDALRAAESARPASAAASVEAGAACIEVLKPGLISSFQDLGRWGSQPLGVPVSGAMDELSHRLANLAVGNAEDEATLEVTLTGPSLRFGCDAVIAWAGADLSPTLFGVPVPACAATFVPAGATLQFGPRVSGLRAYLAVQGGYALAPVMGSASTYARAGFGGHEGRALREGDRVHLRIAGAGAANGAAHRPPANADSPTRLALPPPLPPSAVQALRAPGPDAPIRLLRGREWAQFGDAARQTLLTQPWRIGAQSDRMGYRLQGPRLARETRGDLLSEPVSFGTVQVPPDGQPIVLMAERQTTGGYPKIAQVASVDLPRLAQCAPGDAVRFMLIGLDVAQSLLLARDAAWQALRIAASRSEATTKD